MLNKNHPILCIAFLALALLSTSNALQNNQVSSLAPSESYRFQINNFKFNDMHIGKKYNYFQTDQRIFMMNPNMTIANFVEISIPDIIFAQQVCSKFAFNSAELYSISACKDLSDNTTYLVMVSFLSSRPFYAYSLKTDLKGTVNMMKLSDSVLVVQDQAEATGVSSNLQIFRVNLGLSSSKPVEFVTHADAKTLKGFDSMITAATVKDAVTQQNAMMFYEKLFGSNSFAIDCNQTGAFCKAFVSNSATNSIEVYNIDKSLSALSGSSATFNLPNTTFREWFFLFLAILGCLAILARCTSKKNGNTESEVAREQGVVAEISNNENYRLIDNRDASLVSTPISRA